MKGMWDGTGFPKRNARDIGKQCREHFVTLGCNMITVYDSQALVGLQVDYSRWSKEDEIGVMVFYESDVKSFFTVKFKTIGQNA